MAIQGGPYIVEGTFGLITCYRVGDRGFVRIKSPLTGDRWRIEAAFANSRRSAAHLGMASKMAKPLYRSLSVKKRKVIHFRHLTGLAKKLLGAGFSTEQVQLVLELALSNLRQSFKKPVKIHPMTVPEELFSIPLTNNPNWHQPDSERYKRRRIIRRAAIAAAPWSGQYASILQR